MKYNLALLLKILWLKVILLYFLNMTLPLLHSFTCVIPSVKQVVGVPNLCF